MGKKKIIALDLETIADPAMLDHLPEVKAKGSLKDPVKIAADIDAKKAKQIAEMGLDPTLNLICCVGFCDKHGPGSISLSAATYEAEKKMLLDFWTVLSEYDHFVSFNGRGFDLRCMLLHGMTHGIRPSVNIDKGKYNRIGTNHTDLRGVLAGEGQFAKGTLDYFARKYLGDQKTEGISGDQVQSFWDMGLVDEISNYCEQDCKLTYELFIKAEAAGLLE